MNLQGHKALVTGASKGLGKSIAHKLALHGCSVTLLARNVQLLKQNLKSLPLVVAGQNHSCIEYDLNNLAKPGEIPAKLMDELQKTTVLVNCAGVTNHALLPRLSKSDVLNTVGLNLICPIILSQLSYKPMMKTSKLWSKTNTNSTTKVPVIINISSILSLTNVSTPGTAVYAATKAGLLGFTTSLASELRGKVRVNSVLPGLITETEMGSTATITAPPISLSVVVDKVVEIICDDSINGKCLIVDNADTKFYS